MVYGNDQENQMCYAAVVHDVQCYPRQDDTLQLCSSLLDRVP